jgi:hypothetical protein
MTIGKSPIKARDGRGRAIRTLETIEQDQRAAEMRSVSMTYPEIAGELGVSVTTAYQSATRGMVVVPTEGQLEAQRNELAKLDRRERFLFSVIGSTDATIEQAIAACNAFDRTQKRRAALLGLDAPAKTRVEVITADAVKAEIRRRKAKLGGEDRPSESGAVTLSHSGYG